VVTSAALLVPGAAADAGCHEIAAETVRVAQNLVGPTGDVLLMRARSAVAQALKARSGANGPRPDQAAVHRAAAALRPVLDGSARIIVPWAVTEGHVLACDLALATDRPVLARRELTRALVAAAHSGALRPLLAGGPAIVGLLALQLGSFGVGDAVAARVLEFRGAPHPDDVALTDREREVLGLLATPLSLPDIAVELDIAPSTVKTHVRAIYTKLGVTSRREAVVAGRRRGSLASGRS
jgi:LuxR family transcriptional regulator, maltose regulon positive regulatory protein